MSLINSDDEYADLIEEPRKKRGGRKNKGKILNIISKNKIYIIFIIISIIIGILFGHYFIEPLLSPTNTNLLNNCLNSKEILTKENECLYKLIDEPTEALTNCFS